MSRILFILISLPLFLRAEVGEEEGIRRVRAHLLIDDAPSALNEAKELVRTYPKSKEVGSVLIEAFSANGKEKEALNTWDSLSVFYPDLIQDRHVLEELSWGVLKNGINSTQYGVRLAALVGAYLTQDIRAVPILKHLMRDSNAMIRSVAVQMASGYQDASLKDEIARLVEEEKVWIVRLEVIRAIGALRMKSFAPFLSDLVQSNKTTYEERQFAVEALLRIYDQVSIGEWELLVSSDRAGLRYLACSIADHFQDPLMREGVLTLMEDSHPNVRVAALNAFGLYYSHGMEKERVLEVLHPSLEDPNAAIAITASWIAMLTDTELGEEHLSKWLNDSLAENRRLAAAALARTGERGAPLSIHALKKNQDSYVKVNVALGLLGQRKELKLCSDVIYEFLQNEKRLWMWDLQQNGLFQVLAPSRVRYVDHIPNYPEAIDQMTRLNLASYLSLIEDPRAIDAIKSFLQKRSWGITGVAAATLLQEGDETSLDVVRELLSDEDPNVKLQACLVLAMLGKDESVLEDLKAAYSLADHERKLHILEAVGRVGNTENFAFLLQVLQEPFPILRVAAAAAMIQSLNR